MPKKKSPPKSFTVRRSKWKRGGDDARLLTESGQMCCLGFYARACGYSREQIKLKNDLESLSSSLEDGGCLLGDDIVKHETSFMEVNDDDEREMRGRAREAELKKRFAKFGVKIKFVD